MATQASLDKVQELFIAYYGRPADLAGQTYWADELEASSLEAIIDRFATSAEFDEQYGELTNQQLIAELYKQILDRDPADTPDDEGPAWYAEQLSEGLMTRGEIALAILAGATGDDAVVLQNRKAVADEFTQAVEDANKVYNVEAGKALLATVGADTDPATVDVAGAVAALPDVEEPTEPGEGDSLTLTQRADALTGTDGDDTFEAPVTQNETGSGALANTFETGDVLDGGEGNDVLRADLIGTGTIQDNFASAPISATTSGIEEVYLRAQMPNQVNTVDAEKMADVQQWWTDNSRSNIIIEDIRSATEDTTFGMRETDPGVGFNNFFNALYLEGQVDSGASSFSFVIAETGNAAAELANINVFAINFEHEGEYYSLDSDAVREANTWTELQDALQAEVDAEAALEGLTITHVGGGVFQVVDPNAGLFDIDPAGTVVTSSTTDETKDAVPGLLMPEEGPTITNVVLDGAGNGSQGGALNIGAMSGLRGVEVFEVNVDRDSHLTVMQSANQTAPNTGIPNEFLEVVNLNSIGAEGDLQVGARTVSLDGRANTAGLVNVREVNGEDFAGSLNLGISLNNNTLGRYLDPSDEVVNFTYTGGAQDDLFNVTATQAVSSDADFAMQIDLGAGDDRLILNAPTARAVSVDGGEGVNSIVVSQTHGTAANNTFAAFANFQTYEVEGTGATSHDFTSMSGIENVVIATGTSAPIVAGGNTTLIDLEAQQNVTVSGKNQTIGNQSTADQNFGTITLTDDAGVERTVTLDNTARLSNAANGTTTDQDGILTVASLVMNSGTGTSATRDVIIDSAGERNVANSVNSFSGRDVASLQLTGTQELTFNVNQIADQAAAAGVNASTALDIDASELEGDLNLAVNGAMIGNWGTATNLTDTIVGTAGDNDTLMVYGAQGNSPVTVTDIETVQFGSVGGSLYGDWVTGALDATGIFDAQNVSANNYVIVDNIAGNTALAVNNLSSGTTVNMGDANTNDNGAAINSQVFDDTITLDSGAVAGTPAGSIDVNYLNNIVGDSTQTLNIGTVVAGVGNDTGGFQTVNIDIAHAANMTSATGASTAADDRVLNLTLNEDVRVLNLTGGADNSGFTDTLALGVALPNNLTLIDLSGYEGDVTLSMENVLSAATQTDVRFIMSEDDATIALSDFTGAIAGIQHNSVFEFTAANTTAAPSTWVIDNVIGAADTGGLGTVGTIDNITRFDVSDLGITSFDQIVIDTNDALGNALAGGTFSIRSEAQDDASVLSGTNQNTWEIQVTGLQALSAGDLTADNFIFA